MKRESLCCMLLAGSSALPASAGRLDLDVYALTQRPGKPAEARPPFPRGLWSPGTPVALHGESLEMQAFSHAGYAAIGALGLAESLRGLGNDRYAGRNAVGFGAITAIQLWSGWRLWKDSSQEPRDSSVEFIFLPSR